MVGRVGEDERAIPEGWVLQRKRSLVILIF